MASKALKLAWHRVSGPVRHKQQEMLAATSDHRASRLRWEAQELTKSLAHQVEGEKNRVSRAFPAGFGAASALRSSVGGALACLSLGCAADAVSTRRL